MTVYIPESTGFRSGLLLGGRMSGVKSCHGSSVLLYTRGALESKKVTSSLTDVWQQLFEQQDITVIVICTIHFRPWLHENHTSAPAPGDADYKTEMQEHVYQKPASMSMS